MIVEMEDGRTFEIVVDQRDVAAFELEPFGSPFTQVAPRVMTFMRWTAWHALVRTKALSPRVYTWPEFNVECVEVRDPEEAVSSEVDPTTPDTSGDT